MSLPRDPDKLRDWQRRSAEKAQANAREKAMQEGRYSSMQASREQTFARRTKPLNRYAAIAARNAKRRREEWKRAYHSEARVLWIQAMDCFACGRRGCENAHLESGGMSRKADADTIVNLCPTCHTEQHRIGLASFAESVGRTVQDFHDRAAEIDAAWRAQTDA